MRAPAILCDITRYVKPSKQVMKKKINRFDLKFKDKGIFPISNF